MPITTKVVNLNPAHGEVHTIQLYVIKFATDLRPNDRSVVFFGYSVSSNNKTDLPDIAEIELKVALNTITLVLFSYTFSVLLPVLYLNHKYTVKAAHAATCIKQLPVLSGHLY